MNIDVIDNIIKFIWLHFVTKTWKVKHINMLERIIINFYLMIQNMNINTKLISKIMINILVEISDLINHKK